MVTVELKEIIRREHSIKGKSIRQIARELKHSRKTVRKAIEDPGIPCYNSKKPATKPLMGPYLPIIKRWVEEDRNRPVKQRHTAKRIYDRLKEEYRFPGGERTVLRITDKGYDLVEERFYWMTGREDGDAEREIPART